MAKVIRRVFVLDIIAPRPTSVLDAHRNVLEAVSKIPA